MTKRHEPILRVLVVQLVNELVYVLKHTYKITADMMIVGSHGC